MKAEGGSAPHPLLNAFIATSIPARVSESMLSSASSRIIWMESGGRCAGPHTVSDTTVSASPKQWVNP